MDKVIIYTDGACSGNPGKGGWGAILMCRGKEKIISGGERETTNNRMELMAVIEGLKALKRPCEVEVYSDSGYIVDALNKGWLNKWALNGWQTTKGAVKNQDLWLELLEMLDTHRVEMIKVKGHSGNVHNERCDAIAKGAVLEQKQI